MLKASTNSDKKFIALQNLTWAEYNLIMVAVNTIIQLLNDPLRDANLDDHRREMIVKYNNLFEAMGVNGLPWRGEAISLDDMVIESLMK